MANLIIEPLSSMAGEAFIPGDKSISHRALMFSALASGQSVISNLLEGHDCLATLQVMRALGAHIALLDGKWIVNGQGRFGLLEAENILDCKNSGTTIRLLAGLLSSMPFFSILDGTPQIRLRPMDRVTGPLSLMGAKIYGRNNNKLAPLAIAPSKLHGFKQSLSVKSAQVKSALILAGLYADSQSIITNTKATRDHTERMLQFMGADISSKEDMVIINPLTTDLKPIDITVPGDISSAAFLVVAGVLLANKKPLILRNVGINQTRTGIIEALILMGANIYLSNERSIANEPIADINIEQSSLEAKTFGGEHIVRMIDEIPILAVAAALAKGTTVIKNAEELRVKESDRINKTVSELKKMGVDINATADGMIIKGPNKLKSAVLNSYGDHRMALSMTIAGLLADGPVSITHSEVIDDSFPGFLSILRKLGASIKEVEKL